ncbi:MAG: DUF2294 domain-containing protein [Actinomycetota bacterium]|nr:DUF2294 domain-containing protein [Actinomycetota bacterium]
MSGTEIDRPIGTGGTAAISDLVGRLVSEYTGTESTDARTYLHEDVITVVVKEALTEWELRLVRDGKRELVLNNRRAFRRAMREDLLTGIEEITGRKVRLSANHMEPEIAVDTFVLEDDGRMAVAPGQRLPERWQTLSRP